MSICFGVEEDIRDKLFQIYGENNLCFISKNEGVFPLAL